MPFGRTGFRRLRLSLCDRATGLLDRQADGVAGGPEPPREKARVTIADACQVFIANREAAGLAPATLRKYCTFAKQLSARADSSGYVMLDRFTAVDIDRFRANWKLGHARRASA